MRAEHALAQGLAGVADAFARRIADMFVRATRFDPFTHAETEQALYDRLPEWLEALQREERVELSLKYRNEEFRITAERDAVLGVAHGCLSRRASSSSLSTASRASGSSCSCPIALRRCRGSSASSRGSTTRRSSAFAAGHAARSVLLAPGRSRRAQGDVKLLKRVPWREAPRDERRGDERPCARSPRRCSRARSRRRTSSTAASPIASAPPASRSAAKRIRSAAPSCSSGSSGVSRAALRGRACATASSSCATLSSYGTFVNEKKVAGETTLKRADVIRIGSPGAELHVVDVEGAE